MTSTDAAMAALARLYGPDAETQRRCLPGIADGLHTQLCDLYARPNAFDADTVALNLEGARRAVLRFAEAMRREGQS